MAFHASGLLRFFRSHQAPMPAPDLRGIEYRAAVAALEDAGFWIVRDAVHVVMTNGQRVLTIPRNNPVHAITMEGLLRDAGLSPDQSRALL